MGLHVVPLGVNGAFTRTGLHTNYYLSFGSRSLLVDCGPLIGRALERVGHNVSEIDQIYVSHLHLDHIGGLFEIGLTRYFQNLPPPRVYLFKELAAPLWQHVLKGMMENYIDAMGRARKATPATFFQFVEIPHSLNDSSSQIDISGHSIQLYPVHHVPNSPCHGVVVDEKVILTTDTTFDPKLLERTVNRLGIEQVFHDCSFLPQEKVVHTTYAELLTLPSDLRDLLVLTHYQDDVPLAEEHLELRLGKAGETFRFD